MSKTSDAVAKKKTAKKTSEKQTKSQRVQSKFSPLVLLFAIIVCGLTILIFYIGFSKTIIYVDLVESVEKYDFSYGIDDVDPQIITVEVSDLSEYKDFDTAESVQGVATGIVTIYNHYSANQPLVQTTRLLSEEGILFRTNETVTVPAGGSVTVEVYADEPGEQGDIEPTKFEIVALWDGLKNDIYAVSEDTMTGGIVTSGAVTNKNVKRAKEFASKELLKTAAKMIEEDNNITGEVDKDAMIVEIIEQTVSPEIGDISDEITLETTANVTAFVFDKAKLTELITNDTGTGLDAKKLTYSLEDNGGNVSIVGSIPLLTENSTSLEGLDVNNLTSKTEEQIVKYLEAKDEVNSVDIKFSPFWLQTSPPRSENIKLEAK